MTTKNVNVDVGELLGALEAVLGRKPTIPEVHALLHAVLAENTTQESSQSLTQAEDQLVLCVKIPTDPQQRAAAAVWRNGLDVLRHVAQAAQLALDFEARSGRRSDDDWLAMTLEDELKDITPWLAREVLAPIRVVQLQEVADA